MGGECAALSPCNAKGVECHKSPFDLSNQARSCCMQTFVIGGGGVWCQVYSAPPLHWAAAAGAHLRMEGRWEGREKNREEEGKGHSH